MRILILEDTPTDAELMQDELINSNIEFTSRRVETRKEFLSEIEAFEPDLILSDYMLPAFNGAEALKLVKQKTPMIPVIIVTGSINEETAIRIAFKEVDNKQLELMIQDDGVGFPVATDTAQEESLGLHLVEMLTEQLDGTLTSTKTKGAAFSIRFPAA